MVSPAVGRFIGPQRSDWIRARRRGGVLVVGRATAECLRLLTVRLRRLLSVSGTELAAKTALTMVLFSRAGYLAPLIAINVVHLLGLAVVYRLVMYTPSRESLPHRPAEV